MMNDKVKAIVDGIFANAPRSGETRELYEEVLADCAERFEDLISSGRSEEEALKDIRAALGGMEECISGLASEEKDRGDEKPKGKSGSRGLMDELMMFAANVAAEEGKRGIFGLPVPEEFSVDGVDKVEIMIDDDDVRVYPSTDGMFHMDYTGPNGERLYSERKGNTLHIEIKGKGDASSDRPIRDILTDILTGRGPRREAGCLSVALPESMMGMLRVLSARGSDISVRGLTVKRMSATACSGDVSVEDCEAEGEMSVHTTSGDIRLEGRAAFLNAGSISGNMQLDGAYAEASVKSTSGDIRLTGSTAKLSAVSVSGDISAEFASEAPDEISIRTTSGDAELDLCGSPFSCETKAVSGDVRLHCAQDASARTRVVFNTVSGDIDIR